MTWMTAFADITLMTDYKTRMTWMSLLAKLDNSDDLYDLAAGLL